jgi:hypothetical protein
MKKSLLFLLICFVFIYGCTNKTKVNSDQPIRIIFDSDLGPDYDDVGALAFLHAMADSGKVEILATLASNKHELVVPAINVINTYFGRGELPVGEPKSALGRFNSCKISSFNQSKLSGARCGEDLQKNPQQPARHKRYNHNCRIPD